MASNRAEGRDVHLYGARDRTRALGGLLLNNGVTNKNFHEIAEIILVSDTSFILQTELGTELKKTDDPLQPGNYYVMGSFLINNELFLTRTISLSTGTRLEAFRKAVRARDGRCVVTGEKAGDAYRNLWYGFEAAHIFPLAYESHWIQHDFSRWITLPSATGSSINSDSYKIVHFASDQKGIAGTYVDQKLFNSPERPSDELLRWHFRQAVFANMRGNGEPGFENDFPPGSNMMGEILEGPKAAERMEFELFSRLALHGHTE